MKLTNAQIFDLAFSLESLIENPMPVKLAFKLSQITLAIENHRKSMVLVIDKIPRKNDGTPEDVPFMELLQIENEIAIEPIDQNELFESVSTISPKQLLALMPILKGGNA